MTKAGQPKVSVIIPNYNHASYLEERIESVLSQSYQDFELILMDDCSTDHSVEILKKYENHPKVSQVIFNQNNSGSTFKQWNKGAQAAKGDFVWIAESDDYASPLFLEKMLPCFEQSSDISLVFCKSYIVDKDSAITGNYEKVYQAAGLYESQLRNGNWEIAHHFVYSNYIPNASSVVFKRDCLLKASLLHNPYKLVGDRNFYVNVIKNKSLYFCAENLNYHRSHGSSVRARYFYSLEGIKEMVHLYKNIRNSVDIDLSKRPASIFMVSCWLQSYWMVRSFSEFLILMKYLPLMLELDNQVLSKLSHILRSRLRNRIQNFKH